MFSKDALKINTLTCENVILLVACLYIEVTFVVNFRAVSLAFIPKFIRVPSEVRSEVRS